MRMSRIVTVTHSFNYCTCDNLEITIKTSNHRYIACFARGAFFLIDIGSKMRRYRKNCDTVVTLFEQTVRRHPDKVALVMSDGKSWTFRDLDLYSNTVANCFSQQVITTCRFAKTKLHHVNSLTVEALLPYTSHLQGLRTSHQGTFAPRRFRA